MRLDLYNKQLARIGTLFSWVSLSWTVRYNTSGNFLLETQLTAENAALLKPQNYAILDVDKTKTVMVIQSLQKTNDDHLIATGFDATYLLAKRATASGRPHYLAENAIRIYVRDMQPISTVSLGECAGITTRYQGDVEGGTILAVVQKIAGAADIGLRMRKDGSSLKFECFQGTENPDAKYSAKYGNLSSSTYAESLARYGNVALVKAKDENDSIVTFWVGDTEAENLDRHELYVDLTGEVIEEGETAAQFRERLERYAWQNIAEAQDVETIGFDLHDDRAALGDIVKVMLDLPKITLQARLVGISILNEGNITTKTAEIGKPVVLRR